MAVRLRRRRPAPMDVCVVSAMGPLLCPPPRVTCRTCGGPTEPGRCRWCRHDTAPPTASPPMIVGPVDLVEQVRYFAFPDSPIVDAQARRALSAIISAVQRVWLLS